MQLLAIIIEVHKNVRERGYNGMANAKKPFYDSDRVIEEIGVIRCCGNRNRARFNTLQILIFLRHVLKIFASSRIIAIQ